MTEKNGRGGKRREEEMEDVGRLSSGRYARIEPLPAAG